MRSTPRDASNTLSGVTGTVPPNGERQPTQDPATWYPAPPPGAFYLNQLQPPRQQKMPPKAWVAALIAIGVIVLIAAIGAAVSDGDSEPTGAVATGIGTPAPYDALPGQNAPASWSARPNDPAGQRACDTVQVATVSGDSFKPDPMRLVAADGKQSTNVSIRIAAALLGDRADLAAAAKGAGDETATTIRLGTAALELETACVRAGYYRR